MNTTTTMSVFDRVSRAIDFGVHRNKPRGLAEVRVLPSEWGDAHEVAYSLLSSEFVEERMRVIQKGLNHPLSKQPATLFQVVDFDHPAPNGCDEIVFVLFVSIFPDDN